MPGPAMHHLMAQRLISSIMRGRGLGLNLTTSNYRSLQSLLSDSANQPYFFLGSQGPDFLFFNTKDIHPTLGQFVNFYFEVYDFIEDFKKTLLQVVPQPVLDALEAFDEAVDEVIEDSALLSEIQQTFEEINKLLEGFSATLVEMVKKFISEFNLFNVIQHPYRDGQKPNQKWWWFDALHYRKTGKFAKALLDLSGDADSPEHLYAIGYLTHFAGDTVGHPYVNIISGGPYRSHSQRHKTGENYQDVFNFQNVTNNDFNRSKLHQFYNFNFDGSDDLDANTNLPDKLAKLIADAINKVYQEDPPDPEVEYGSLITPEDLNSAYRLWYKWFKNATDAGTIPAPIPYSLTAELREVWEKAMDNLDEAGDFLENAVDEASNAGVWGIFLILAGVIISAVMAGAAIADGVAGSIATLGTSTIRYAACLIYEQIYNAFQNFRLGVSANGLAFPMIEHLTEPRLRQFANPSIPDLSGANASDIHPYFPKLRIRVPNFVDDPLSTLFHQEQHLNYPITELEKSHVNGAPKIYFDKLASFYGWGAIPFDNTLIDKLASLSANPSPRNNDNGTNLYTLLKEYNFSLGNAQNLTQAIYDRWKVQKAIPDFNLDGDRGYGYLCWTQEQIPPAGVTDPVEFPKEIAVQIDETDTVHVRFIH